jgi:hypothetical protein
MDNSAGMIERHYSKLTATMAALTVRYRLQAEKSPHEAGLICTVPGGTAVCWRVPFRTTYAASLLLMLLAAVP